MKLKFTFNFSLSPSLGENTFELILTFKSLEEARNYIKQGKYLWMTNVI